MSQVNHNPREATNHTYRVQGEGGQGTCMAVQSVLQEHGLCGYTEWLSPKWRFVYLTYLRPDDILDLLGDWGKRFGVQLQELRAPHDTLWPRSTATQLQLRAIEGALERLDGADPLTPADKIAIVTCGFGAVPVDRYPLEIRARCAQLGLEILQGAGPQDFDPSKLKLTGADLSNADLSRAQLRGIDLFAAHLSGADLSGADLSGARLGRVNLYGANLYAANLSLADLSWADLRTAHLSRADLRETNLTGADLAQADLSYANLSRAILHRAVLSQADLREAKLEGATMPDGTKHD